MLTNEGQVPLTTEEAPQVSTNGNNSVDVNLKDTVGAVFLGILSVILLIGWVRAEARLRELLVKTANGTP
ncbi:MAG TPA: hypothetical protein VK909_22110 [Anaerolineales bacterium]|nr:hypothetical protein [Anaerolineales bacterium]